MGRAFTSAALQGKMEIVTMQPQEQGGRRSLPRQKNQNTDIIINRKNKQSENLSHFWKQLEQPSDNQLHEEHQDKQE